MHTTPQTIHFKLNSILYGNCYMTYANYVLPIRAFFWTLIISFGVLIFLQAHLYLQFYDIQVEGRFFTILLLELSSAFNFLNIAIWPVGVFTFGFLGYQTSK